MIISIGNFDGVHAGHQALLRGLTEQAQAVGVKSQVITFDIHPKTFFSGEQIRLIYDTETKIKALKNFGVDEILVIDFDKSVADMTGQEFLDHYIGLGNIAGIVQGDNFAFGHMRSCDIDCLKKIGEGNNFKVQVIGLEQNSDQVVSSSVIRDLLQKNKISEAYLMFGGKYFYNYPIKEYDYSINNKVVHGNKFGRTIETPTANLEGKYSDIESGVYAGKVIMPDGIIRAGAISVHDNQVEVHIIDWSGDLYGQTLQLNFAHRLRDYVSFDTSEALITQIKRDLLVAWQLYLN